MKKSFLNLRSPKFLARKKILHARAMKGVAARERLRIAGIIGAKSWVVTKADQTVDVDASTAKLSQQIADSSHDEQVFAWKEPGT